MEEMLQGIKNIMMFSVAHKPATNDMFHNSTSHPVDGG